MKRVVFYLSLFFLLFTLSTAFRVTKLDLTHATKLSDHIESTDVPDHTRSQDTEIITKEYIDHLKRMNRVQVQTSSGLKQYYLLKNRFNPHRCRHRNPVRFVGVNEVGFNTVRESGDDGEVVFPGEAKVLRHRHVARNFPGVEGDEQRMGDRHYMIPQYRLRHRHRHHHHHNDLIVEEDAQGVEVKEAINEEGYKDDEHEGRGKHILKKIGKFLGYF